MSERQDIPSMDDMTILAMAMATGDGGQAIEDFEALRGEEQRKRLTLPIEGCDPDVATALGIELGEPVDDLFRQVVLPDGWHKRSTDHHMHTELVDGDGRIRAYIFYKAAPYDRRANMSFARAISSYAHYLDIEKGQGWEAKCKAEQQCTITLGAKVLWQSAVVAPTEDNPHGAVSNALHQEAREWLNENYPDWESPAAYWG